MMSGSKPQRVAFGQGLLELADEYPNLVVLDADVSSSTQTKLFGDQYPERFFNFGIAEGNMVSAAAGMAACGLIPVAATFAFLMALRAGDAVRSLVAYGELNVKLVGGYAGLSDYADGASHQAVTDLALMRALPNLTNKAAKRWPSYPRSKLRGITEVLPQPCGLRQRTFAKSSVPNCLLPVVGCRCIEI
jgi:transketolase